MKKIFLLFILIGLSRANAQISFTGEYTNSFDGYTTAATIPLGWSMSGGSFQGTGTGTGTAGGFYSFNPSCCSSDRSLGALHSGSSTGTYTASFVNSTGSTITSLSISYDFEQYRSAGNTTGWDVKFNSVLNAALGAAGITTVTTGVPYVLNRNTTLTGLSIAPGASFNITWTVNDASGSDNPVAIDNFKMCVPGAAFNVTASNSSPVSSPSPVTLTGSATLGTPAYTFSWVGPGSYSAAGASPVITPSSVANSGIYTVTVTDAAGCTAKATTNVVVNPGSSCTGTPVPGAAGASPASICGSGSSAITVTGASTASGLTYQWQSSATGVIGSFADISGATAVSYNTPVISATTYYRLVITCTGSGLSDTSSVATVTVNTLPTISVTPDGGGVCAGGSGLSMTASGANTYTWTPAAGLSAVSGPTVTANPLSNTIYSVSGTSTTTGCTGTGTVSVTYNLNPSALSITPPSVTICQNGGPQILTATGGQVGPTTVNSGSVTIPASIGSLGTITTSLLMAGIPAGAVITGASVNIISFGSQYQDDYDVNIKAPNGNILNLISTRGTHSSTVTTLFANTILSSASATSLASGSGSFTGTWRADALSGVGGGPNVSNVTTWAGLYSVPNGMWTLSIYNHTTFANTVVPSMQWSITLDYTYQSAVTWSPVTDLYTDAAGTIPYTGGAAGSVYMNPVTAGVTTYSATATNVSCASQTTAVVSINPVPVAITGNANVCYGLTTTLSDATPGGTWHNGGSLNASVDAGGIVSGLLAGTADITYTLPTGCTTTRIVTVNPLPATIGGMLAVCKGLTTTLTETSTGGTWSALSADVSVDASGVVTGINAGTATMTYTLPTSCIATAVVTVNPLPDMIAGTPEVCLGQTTALTETTTGGTWSSSLPGIAPVDASGIVAGSAAGNATITYTLPTSCIATRVVTVHPLPAAITGVMTVCKGLTTLLNQSVTGGTWSSGATGIATVDAAGLATGVNAGIATITYTLPTGCIATAIVTVNDVPAPIGGPSAVCAGLTVSLSEATTGGAWSSSAPANATIDAVTGVVSGIAAGTSAITYMVAAGCMATTTITVNPAALPITGATNVCAGSSITLTNSGGGTWASSNSNAFVGLTTGIVTGSSAGTSTITYTLPTGCKTTITIVVNPLPAPIGGPSGVCVASSIVLTNSTSGGTWASSNTNASVGVTSGVVNGISAGVSLITYKLPTGCIMVKGLSISPLPAPVAGPSVLCQYTTITLTDASTGGAWSSGSPHAIVDPATGVVTGLSGGPATISYTISAGCSAIKNLTINPVPYSASGTPAACIGATTTLMSSPLGGTWTASNSNATVGLMSGIVTGITEGTVIITYTLPATGCTTLRIVTVAPLPAAITGATAFCRGSSITLSNATPGGSWSTSSTNVTIGSGSGVVTGLVAGSALLTYTMPSGCLAHALVSVNPLPNIYSVTGGGNYCAGSPGVYIGLSGSDAGVTYQLYNGGTIVTSFTGTSFPIDFGLLPLAGTYTVHAGYAGTGCAADMSGSAFVSITPSVTPSVSFVTSTGSDVSCAGALIKFTATPVNGGTLPVYYWTVNGMPTGISVDSFTYTPVSGDIVKVKMVSNAVCPAPDSAVSSHIITVLPTVIPYTIVEAVPGNIVCAGTQVTFNATPVGGGSAPVLMWNVNGVSAASGTSYVYTPANGDIVSATLVTNAMCRLTDTVTSGYTTMDVQAPVIPGVSITASPGVDLAAGQFVTFIATVTNGTPAVGYQWNVDGIPVPGATFSSFSGSSFANNSIVSCVVTNTDVCNGTGSDSVKLRITNGLNELNGKNVDGLHIFPNPNNGMFTLAGTLSRGGEVAIAITDVLGQVVYAGNVPSNAGSINEKIMLGTSLANGMYILNVKTGSENKVIHFVVKQ